MNAALPSPRVTCPTGWNSEPFELDGEFKGLMRTPGEPWPPGPESIQQPARLSSRTVLVASEPHCSSGVGGVIGWVAVRGCLRPGPSPCGILGSVDSESGLARSDFGVLRPMPQPEAIPPPERVWTSHEWDLIRRGHRSQDMDDKWHALVEDQRLYLYRSWTGMGVYEAEFAADASGWRIIRAVVAGDHDSYRRGGDEYESALLEAVIEWILLDVRNGPGHRRWERARHDISG
jgi:hypothetical protein